MERSAEPTHCGDVELGESNQSKPELGESNQSKPDLPSAQAPEAAPSAPSPGVAERKPSRQQDPSLDSQCFPRAGRAHRKMASRRKFDGLQSQSSPLQRLVIESAPWVILGAGVAVAIIIIALQPPRAPEYPSTSSPPLSTTCLQARRAAGATGEPARSCLFVLSGSRSAQFKGHETAVHSYNGSHWLEEKPLSTACHELGSRPVKPAGVGRALTAGLSATLGRRIYVIGVAGDGCFQSYDGSADWRTEEPLPEEIRREGASLITYRNALYLLGGYDRCVLSSASCCGYLRHHLTRACELPRGSGETVDWVSFFVPKELKGLGTWQEGPALPTARSGMAACVAFGRLFTLGGSYTPTVESFDGSRLQPAGFGADEKEIQMVDCKANGALSVRI